MMLAGLSRQRAARGLQACLEGRREGQRARPWTRQLLRLLAHLLALGLAVAGGGTVWAAATGLVPLLPAAVPGPDAAGADSAKAGAAPGPASSPRLPSPWPPPWREVVLPNAKAPPTRFSVVGLDGSPALRVEAEGSYGTLVHAAPPGWAPGQLLRWRWRLERPNSAADIRLKAGDDAALKVCAMFELPLDQVPFVERQLLRLARAVTGEPLPAATVCYLWDSRLPAGTVLPNPYTRRVRVMVLRGPEQALGRWQAESRDLAADFRQLFGDEARGVPPLAAIVVGADADNTGARSLGHLAGLVLD